MLEVLAEAAWTPSMVGTGIIGGIILAVKLIPWSKKESNGNGTAKAAQNGEARGKMEARLDGHDKEIDEQKKVSADQWTMLGEQSNRLTAIETSTGQTAKDVSEMKTDLKDALKNKKGNSNE